MLSGSAFFLSACFFCLFLSGPALAACDDAGGDIATSACDCRVQEAQKKKAYLEESRAYLAIDMIPRPDSTMALTCLDQSMDVAADAAKIFSDNPEWTSEDGILPTPEELVEANGITLEEAEEWLAGQTSPETLEAALTDTVGKGIRNYLVQTVGDEPMMGGKSLVPGYKGDSDISKEGGYNCSMMSQVWHASKCWNPGTRPEEQYYSLDELANAESDLRTGGLECVKDEERQGIARDTVKTAEEETRERNKDVYKAVSERTNRDSCTAPIKTSLKYENGEPKYTCSNNCSYDRKSEICVNE